MPDVPDIRLFKKLTAAENVKAAMNMHMKYGLFSALFRRKGYWEEEKEIQGKALEAP